MSQNVHRTGETRPVRSILCHFSAGKGDELPGRPAQDLVFVVRQKPHAVFTRDGDDLVATLRISIRWARGAALGAWLEGLGWR